MTLQKSDTQQHIAHLLPEFDNDGEGKRTFLSFRICGFSIDESLRYTGILSNHLDQWKLTDEIFDQIHTHELNRLQVEATDSILELAKIRNHRLALAVDEETLDDAVTHGINSLSEKQFEYLKTIRNKYDSKVTSLLGLEPGDKMPLSLDEVTLRFRRANAEHTSVGDERNEEGSEIATGEESIIEAEYTESPGKPNRNKRRKKEKTV